MALTEKINSKLKGAIKNGEALKVSTLRMVLSALHNREIEKRSKSQEPLTEDEVLDVLKKEVKKRKESIEIYGQAGRDDLKDKEIVELKIVQSYLPPELSDEAIEEIVQKVVASGEKDFGKVMKAVMAEVKGQADSRKVSEIVKSKIS